MATRRETQTNINNALEVLKELEEAVRNVRMVLNQAKFAVDYENSIDPQEWTQARLDRIVNSYTPTYNAAKADIVAKYNRLP